MPITNVACICMQFENIKQIKIGYFRGVAHKN